MADNVTITQGSGKTVLADEVVDGTFGTGVVQFVKIMDATADGTNKAVVTSGGALKVDGSAVTQPVSGTFWQATQPVSASSLPLPTGASTSAKQPALGTAGTASTDVLTVQGITSMTPLKVDGSGVTQPVSGTITANIGTSGSLALDATLTGGTQQTKITDGTNVATVKAASTAAGAADKAVVVAVSPNNTVGVTGTFWQTTQPVSIATMPTTPVTGTFWQTTQPVSGSVTANIGTSGSLALDATLTGGTQQTKITDGTNVASVKAASTAAGATDKAVVVAVSPNNTVAVSGTFWQTTQPVSIASMPSTPVTGTFWQATQPVSGTVTTSPPSNASTNVAQINAVTPLMGNGVTGTGSQRVTIASDNTAFSVNANAGTNLNTSALALETGGNLASIKADVDNLNLSQGSTTSGQKGNLTLGAVTTASPTYTTAQSSPLSLDTTGALRVNVTAGGSGGGVVTQATGSNLHTVVDSGTITANIGTSGSLALDATLTGGSAKTKLVDSGGTNVGTIKAASTAAATTDTALVVAVSPNNSVAVTGTFWQATQPVSGTFWQATQPVSGTVTTSPPSNASSNVAQINGVTPLMGNGVTGTGSLRVTVASDNTAFSVNAAQSGTWNIGSVTTLPALPANQSVNNTQINGVTPLMGNGVTGTGSQRVTIASDNTAFSVNAVQSGTWNVGTVTTVSAVTAISNALPAGTNLMGKVGIDQTTAGTTNGVVENATSAAGGIVSTSRILIAAASTNATAAKSGAARLYAIQGYNAATTTRYLKIYNKASAPTVGTDTPVKTLALPPGVGFAFDWPVGYYFSTGIAYALTVGAADADTAALTLADVLGLNVDFV